MPITSHGRRYALLILGCLTIALCFGEEKQPEARRTVLLVEEFFYDNWIGVVDNGLYVYRLTLYSDHTGVYGAVFLHSRPRIYSIKHWKFEKGVFTFDASPVGKAEPIRMEGVAQGGSAIELTVHGINLNWERKPLLMEEEKLETGLGKLRIAMEATQFADTLQAPEGTQ